MSRNWYATVKVDAHETTNIIHIHIGKTGGMVGVDANLFPSFAAMIEFFRNVEENLFIIDEEEHRHSLDDLIQTFHEYTLDQRKLQHLANMRAGATPHESYLDDEGFTMSRGNWS